MKIFNALLASAAVAMKGDLLKRPKAARDIGFVMKASQVVKSSPAS